MSSGADTSVRSALRRAVKDALKRRDRRTADVYRSALAAIDNAEAVPANETARTGAIGASAVGVGRTDTPRRSLTERQMMAVVAAEAQERRTAAALVEATHPATAERLRQEAVALQAFADPLRTD